MLYIFEVNETKYWKKDFLEEYGINEIMAQYVVDTAVCWYLCELTPSYELCFVQNQIIFKSDTVEDVIEAAESFVMQGTSNDSRYVHCRVIDTMLSEENKHLQYIGERKDFYDDYDPDAAFDNAAYNSWMEAAREECQANWRF